MDRYGNGYINAPFICFLSRSHTHNTRTYTHTHNSFYASPTKKKCVSPDKKKMRQSWQKCDWNKKCVSQLTDFGPTERETEREREREREGGRERQTDTHTHTHTLHILTQECAFPLSQARGLCLSVPPSLSVFLSLSASLAISLVLSLSASLSLSSSCSRSLACADRCMYVKHERGMGWFFLGGTGPALTALGNSKSKK
jgi:hypothetical protein